MTMRILRRGQPERHARADAPTRGFSLMEALTVIGIMTIVLVMVTQIFAVTYDVYVKQSARTENESGAVLAARTIADLTRGGSQVVASQVINGTTYVTGPETLVIKLPTVDASNNVLAATYDYVAIYRDGTLTTKIFSDTEANASSRRVSGKKLVTAYNQTLRFRYNDPVLANATRVQVYLVNQQTTRSTTLTTKGWTAIFLRNND